MELRRLLHAFHASDFGQDFSEQAGCIEQLKCPSRVAFGEHLEQLVANTLTADLMNVSRMLLDGGEGGRLNLIFEAGGKANRPQHAQLVFREAAFRLSDGANDSGLKVGAPADVIEDLAGRGIHEEAIDGEVAALNVFLRALRVAHRVGMAAI